MATHEDVEREVRACSDLEDALTWFAPVADLRRMQMSTVHRGLVWIVRLFGCEPQRIAISVEVTAQRLRECLQIVGPEYPDYDRGAALLARLEAAIDSHLRGGPVD